MHRSPDVQRSPNVGAGAPGGETKAEPALVVVLDRTGRITAHNEHWMEAGVAAGLRADRIGPGTDYLAACDSARGPDEDIAARAAVGIRAVLDGERSSFHLDYPCHLPDRQRWFSLRVTPLAGPSSGALVSHLDITAVRETEFSIRDQLGGIWRMVDPDSDFVLLIDADGYITDAACEREQLPWERHVVGERAVGEVHPARPGADPVTVRGMRGAPRRPRSCPGPGPP